MTTKMQKDKPQKDPELLKKKQLLIEKFCKAESIKWPNEMRNIGTLLKSEPIEFWSFLVLGFKLNSLAWFLSKDGKKEVEKNKKTFLALQIKKSPELKTNNEYVRVTEPKKSLADRLKNK